MRLGYGWNVWPFEIADNDDLAIFARVGEAMRALGEIKFGIRNVKYEIAELRISSISSSIDVGVAFSQDKIRYLNFIRVFCFLLQIAVWRKI